MYRMPRFEKGSQEAKDYMARLRAMRGRNPTRTPADADDRREREDREYGEFVRRREAATSSKEQKTKLKTVKQLEKLQPKLTKIQKVLSANSAAFVVPATYTKTFDLTKKADIELSKAIEKAQK